MKYTLMLLAFACLLAGCTTDLLTDVESNATLSEATLSKNGAVKVPLIDACEIFPVFCAGGVDGVSDIPDYKGGFAILNKDGKDRYILNVQIRGSLGSTEHTLYVCGVRSPGGFGVCTTIGELSTDAKGHGVFHAKYNTFPHGSYLAINAPDVDTIIANSLDTSIQ